MKLSVKSILVALAMLLGGTMLPSASQAQTFHGGNGNVVVRDRHGDRVITRRGDFRRDGRRAYRDRYYGGPRHYRASRFDRRHDGRRYYDRRHHRGNGVVIRLR